MARLTISLSHDVLGFPPLPKFGLNGGYTTIFHGSPSTSEKFVKYLQFRKCSLIETGRRGDDYYISWDGPFVDVPEWRGKGFPIKD